VTGAGAARVVPGADIMPGLPAPPQAEHIDLVAGRVTGMT
jgi:fumarate hydratase class II